MLVAKKVIVKGLQQFHASALRSHDFSENKEKDRWEIIVTDKNRGKVEKAMAHLARLGITCTRLV